MSSKTIDLPNIGPVLFQQSKRVKHINISVKPPAIIRVAIPRGISFKKAANFTATKEAWINKTLRKVKLRSNKQRQIKPVNKGSANIYLLGRLEEMAKEHGFRYNKATVRNQKTRWGSCSAKNNISLNMQLMNLPEELIDYVILHELVHTKVKNHSKTFWATLDQYNHDAKQKNRALKDYTLQ